MITPAPVTSQSVSTGSFLGTLVNMALNALETAAKKTKDETLLPLEAANEFVKGFSGKAGEATVELFGELIKGGFGSDDKDMNEDKKAKLLAIIFRSVTKGNCLPENYQFKRITLKKQILFGTNKATLSNKSANDAIELIRTFVHAHPDSIILLSSNTDTTGSPVRNNQLAKQRTKVVRDKLISDAGIQPNRIFSVDLATQSLQVITPKNSDEPLNRSVTVEAIDLLSMFELSHDQHLPETPRF